MIWTEEENTQRQIDNMLKPKGKTCKNCYWGGGGDLDEFITCGTHLQNFRSNSLCDYLTSTKDKALVLYNEKKKKELLERIKTKK